VFVAAYVANLFKSRRRLEAENLFLRHQLNIALRRRPPRLRLRCSSRVAGVDGPGLWPSLVGLARVVEPATILRWHRAGFTNIGAGNPEVRQEDPGSISRWSSAISAVFTGLSIVRSFMLRRLFESLRA
jgi:hypothetical protein